MLSCAKEMVTWMTARMVQPKLTAAAAVSVMMNRGVAGSGSGKGGGSGGNIREAGGKFGEKEAAHENQYFRQLQQEQLKDLKKVHEEEIEFHESQIRHHEALLDRHKKQAADAAKNHDEVLKK